MMPIGTRAALMRFDVPPDRSTVQYGRARQKADYPRSDEINFALPSSITDLAIKT